MNENVFVNFASWAKTHRVAQLLSTVMLHDAKSATSFAHHLLVLHAQRSRGKYEATRAIPRHHRCPWALAFRCSLMHTSVQPFPFRLPLICRAIFLDPYVPGCVSNECEIVAQLVVLFLLRHFRLTGGYPAISLPLQQHRAIAVLR